MQEMLGYLMLLLLIVGCVWGAHFGAGLGKDIARYQIGKREELARIEKRLKDLEQKSNAD